MFLSIGFRKEVQKKPPKLFYKKKMFFGISQYSQKDKCVGVSFNKIAVLKACNFIKKKLQHRCFPVNIAKFLRTAFYRTPLLAPAKLSLLNPKKKLFNKSLVMKTFKCPLPIDFAFIIPISAQNIQHSWRQHFLARTSLLS